MGKAEPDRPWDERLLEALERYGADPSSEDALCELARAYLALGRGEDAFVTCSTAQVRTQRLMMTEAEVFSAQGFHSDASTMLQRVLSKEKGPVTQGLKLEATLLLGKVRLGMKRHTQAFNTFRRLLEQDPRCAQAQGALLGVLREQAEAASK